MTTGIIVAALYLITASKVVTKRIKVINRKKALLLHKVSGILLLLVAALHLLLSVKLLHQRPVSMYVFGIIMFAAMITCTFSYFLRKRQKSRWLCIHRSAAALILICFVCHVLLGITSLQDYKQNIEEIELKEIPISEVADGSYIGAYDAGYIYAKVQVDVSDGELQKITLLEHRTERGKLAEVILDKITGEQRVDVSDVSGATNSSKVIKAAVCNALQQGMENN